MKRIGFFVACGALALAMGCDNRPSGERDGGGITLMDSGPGMMDAGTRDSGGGDTCPPATESPPAGNVCAQTTFDCIMAATTQAALQACLDADPMRDACVACINQEVIACATTRGCDDEYGEVGCCLQTACPTATDACVNAALDTGGACADDFNTFIGCAQGLGMTCGFTALCFPPAS